MTGNIFNDFENNRDYTIERLDRIPSAVCLFTVSDEIRFLHFNKAAEALLGYGDGELMAITSRDPLLIFHHDYEDQLFSAIIATMGKTHIFHYDCRMLCRDGKYKWINISAELMQKSGGALCYYCLLTEIPVPKETILKDVHVLVTSADESVRKTLRSLIGEHGGTCDVYENGLDALDRFTDEEPDYYQCVFIDFHTGRINGFELAKEIRHCGRPLAGRIPVILSIENGDDSESAATAGITKCIGRPLDSGAAIRALTELTCK